MGDIWGVIRAACQRRFTAMQEGEEGITQKKVATSGGLAGQNAVSRLLSNDKRGPTVENFLRGIWGLGWTLKQFAEDVEPQLPKPGDVPWSPSSLPPAPADIPTEDEKALAVGRAAIKGYQAELERILAARNTSKKPT
jgi:hypothetical protein